MDEVSTPEPPMPAAVELRYPPIAIAARVAMGLLLAIGASILLAGFLQVALMQAAAHVGETALFVCWTLCLALFIGVVWWQANSFLLRADADGITCAAGWKRWTIKWAEFASAEACEPANAGGKEYMEGLFVVLRDQEGRKLISLGYDIRRGLRAEQVSMFKRYVREQLNAHHVAKAGPALAWTNWA